MKRTLQLLIVLLAGAAAVNADTDIVPDVPAGMMIAICLKRMFMNPWTDAPMIGIGIHVVIVSTIMMLMTCQSAARAVSVKDGKAATAGNRANCTWNGAR